MATSSLPLLFLLLLSFTALAEPSKKPIPKPNVRKFACEEDAAVALAKYISFESNKYVKGKGSFSVVLSGGSLIDTMRKLTEPPYDESIEWSKWLVFWIDERVVPLTDPRSNFKLAYDGFLSKVGIPQESIYAINDKLSPEGAANDYEIRIKDLVEENTIGVSTSSGLPNFDLMLVGMGPDGHVASMFPGHPQRFEKKRWVTFIKDSPKPPPERITLTFPVINSASDIAVVVTGAELANATCIALGKCNNPQKDLLPVQTVSPERKLTWFLDKEAASKL